MYIVHYYIPCIVYIQYAKVNVYCIMYNIYCIIIIQYTVYSMHLPQHIVITKLSDRTTNTKEISL